MAHRQRPAPRRLSAARRGELINRLGGEGSLYLRAHAGNPIAWQPWGPEALAAARTLNRPILLSIGYAACHWCHRMAEESFADPVIAREVNTEFVAIKVDREERPDLDDHFQRALERLGGTRGWPLTLFLTPDGQAFAGGTYYPAVDDHALPGFGKMLRAQAAFYRSGLTQGGAPAVRAPAPPAEERLDLDKVAALVLDATDPLAGGLRGSPKFPRLPLVETLLRAGERTGDRHFLDAAARALDAMCLGALYDHVDGGFMRYCTDAHWQIPHYEKMLPDNAQFVGLLSLAWRQSPNDLWASRVAETVDWLIRRLAREDGAFGASLSADAGGLEGGEQIWSRSEIETLLGEEMRLFATVYAVPAPGGGAAPLRQLRRRIAPSDQRRIDACLARLRQARARGAMAVRDDKRIAEWNGLAIRALAWAALVFDRPDWLISARRAWGACIAALARDGGGLWRVRSHSGGVPALLGDYAALALAGLALHEATGEPGFLDRAQRWARVIMREFGEAAAGFRQSAEPGLGRDAPALEDGASPAGTALALELFARLSALDAVPWSEPMVQALLAGPVAAIAGAPLLHAGLLNAADLAMRPTLVTIAGMPAQAEAWRWRQTIFAGSGFAALLADNPIAVAPQAIICRDRRCSLPLRDPLAVVAMLRDAVHPVG